MDTFSLTNLESREAYDLLTRDLLNRVFNFDLKPKSDTIGRHLLSGSTDNSDFKVLAQVFWGDEINANDYAIVNRDIADLLTSYFPQKYILVYYYDMELPHLELVQNDYPEIPLEYYNLKWIKEQLRKYPEIARKYNISPESYQEADKSSKSGTIENKVEKSVDFTTKMLALNNSGKNFFALGHIWGNEDQFGRFLEEGTWENGHDDKLTNVVRRIKSGDIVFLQSSYSGIMRVKVIGVVFANIDDGHKILVNWHRLNKHIDIPGRGAYRSAIAQIGKDIIPFIIDWIYGELPNFFDIINGLENNTLHAFDKPQLKRVDIDTKGKQYWWLNAPKNLLDFEKTKVGTSQLFISGSNDEAELTIFQSVEKGDFGIVFQDGKIKATVEVLEKSTAEVKDDILLEVKYKFNDKEQLTLEELKQFEIFRYSEVVGSINQGVIIPITEVEYEEIVLRTSDVEINKNEKLDNNIHKTILNNDGAYTTEDLLNIENDVRSFALLLASKDVKPPLAIALFGKWGSGKSFFMEHLSKRIDELSINQGFLERGEIHLQQEGENNEDVFCRGIAQIKFNAWSYLDANLWAGVVSSIFEKLDEYISKRSKGDIEKLELRDQLSSKLEILSSEKKVVKNEIQSLEEEKATLEVGLESLISDKEHLINNIADKKLSEIVDAVIQKSKIKEGLEADLVKYGITEERLNELSPTELYLEFNSWLTFFKNLFKFSAVYKIGFIVAALALIFVWIDPCHWASNFFNQIGREITAVISIVGPLFLKVYNTFSKYKKLAEPITDYKNKFIKDLEEAMFEYEQEKSLLEIKIKSKQIEITQAENKITELETQIDDLDYTLNNFVAKRAFNNFIKRKVKDKGYHEHLGLISIIRKDFETLSDLFQDTLIDNNAPQEIQEAQREKKEEHKNIAKLFKDEKVLDRIILYIDDLDRCSDEKVLEVIQAVHLLMAFPLFNVVVGVDKRCVNNALIYKNLLQYSQFTSLAEVEKRGIHVISPGEYLEKIFQIPFQLNDPSDDDIKGMVDKFLDGQFDSGPKKEEPVDKVSIGNNIEDKIVQREPALELQNEEGNVELSARSELIVLNDPSAVIKETPKRNLIKATDLKLELEERELLREMIWLVSKTPRTIKRYLNIYRIVRAHQDLRIDNTQKTKEFLAIMFILAMNIGENKKHAPELMDCIMENTDKRLIDIFDCEELKYTFKNDHAKFENIRKDILRNALIADLLEIKSEQFHKHIKLVGRFSFGSVEYNGVLSEGDKEHPRKTKENLNAK